jgi:hypothetical protein
LERSVWLDALLLYRPTWLAAVLLYRPGWLAALLLYWAAWLDTLSLYWLALPLETEEHGVSKLDQVLHVGEEPAARPFVAVVHVWGVAQAVPRVPGHDLNLDKSSVADPGCLSRILIFTHPGSRISDPKTATKERVEKKFVVITFNVATNFTKLKIILVLKC